ncbi:MAG: response regulator transcription factor [Planctomycetes bacterium]|nr:response regulator transcription factor [Planctomycetota bacterium]
MSPIVYVVDDDPAVRNSMRWLLESARFATQTYESARAFLADYRRDRPGCLLLDVRMPEMSGLELQATLVGQPSLLPIIIVTGHADVPMAVRALKQGAFDFLEKPCNDESLLSVVQRALDFDIQRFDSDRRVEDILHRLALLTPRESEVLQLVVDGNSNKEMAAQLGLSSKTIEVHRSHLMTKMRAGSVAELVQMHVAAASHRKRHELERVS